jgi:hypothetical protein
MKCLCIKDLVMLHDKSIAATMGKFYNFIDDWFVDDQGAPHTMDIIFDEYFVEFGDNTEFLLKVLSSTIIKYDHYKDLNNKQKSKTIEMLRKFCDEEQKIIDSQDNVNKTNKKIEFIRSEK